MSLLAAVLLATWMGRGIILLRISIVPFDGIGDARPVANASQGSC